MAKGRNCRSSKGGTAFIRTSLLRLELMSCAQPFENWHAFYAPMKDGIDHVSAFETFTAYATVQLFERQTIFGVWKAVETIDFENSCLEFGGSYAGKHPAKRL